MCWTASNILCQPFWQKKSGMEILCMYIHALMTTSGLEKTLKMAALHIPWSGGMIGCLFTCHLVDVDEFPKQTRWTTQWRNYCPVHTQRWGHAASCFTGISWILIGLKRRRCSKVDQIQFHARIRNCDLTFLVKPRLNRMQWKKTIKLGFNIYLVHFEAVHLDCHSMSRAISPSSIRLLVIWPLACTAGKYYQRTKKSYLYYVGSHMWHPTVEPCDNPEVYCRMRHERHPNFKVTSLPSFLPSADL